MAESTYLAVLKAKMGQHRFHWVPAAKKPLWGVLTGLWLGAALSVVTSVLHR